MRSVLRLVTIVTLACALLSGCARYQVMTNRAADYSTRPDKVFVWSALGSIPSFRHVILVNGDSFENLFNAAMKQALVAAGVTVEVRPFVPANDEVESLVRFEQDLKPDARLVIQPKRYQTITRYGTSSVTGLWLDLSVYDVATGRRVWRGELFVDPALDLNPWGASGAEKIAAQIVDALRKDKLVAAVPSLNR